MCKLNPVYEKSSILNNQKIEQLDNRPRLLHKVYIATLFLIIIILLLVIIYFHRKFIFINTYTYC